MELKLVILDYPSKTTTQSSLEAESARRVFADLISLRQRCFAGVRDTFLNLDSNDLCATHVLLYDQSNLFQPRIVAGLRICWGDRTDLHHIRLPFVERMLEIGPRFEVEFSEYRKKQPVLVNPNMWYVSPDLGFNKTKVPLSEILIWVMSHIIRKRGFDGYCAVINEEFKTSRWFQNYGDWNQSLEYQHPTLLKLHKVMFVNAFYDSYLEQGEKRFGHLYQNRCELVPIGSAITTETSNDTKAA